MRTRISASRVVKWVCLVPVLSLMAPASVAGTSATETYELHVEVPNISEAPNGDRIAVTGSGMFAIHPKSVVATGTFTHTDSAGNLLGRGTWTALESSRSSLYGCGFVSFPDPGVILPPTLRGTTEAARDAIDASGAARRDSDGLLHHGPNAPDSHDDPSGEGVHLNAIGVINFNKIVSGMNVYIKTS